MTTKTTKTLIETAKVIGITRTDDGTKLVKLMAGESGLITARLIPGIKSGKEVTVIGNWMPPKGNYQGKYFWDIVETDDAAFAMDEKHEGDLPA